MKRKKSYHQFCGVARALDLVGERWTLLLVRHLLLGPWRYGELLRAHPGITTNLLALRLAQLGEAGIIASDGERYRLTPLGQALDPVVNELGRWGWHQMNAPKPGDRVDAGWAMLSLRRRYRGGLRKAVEIRVGSQTFDVGLRAQTMTVQERTAASPEVTLTFRDFAGFRDGLILGQPHVTLEKRGSLTIEGDRRAAVQVLAAFQ